MVVFAVSLACCEFHCSDMIMPRTSPNLEIKLKDLENPSFLRSLGCVFQHNFRKPTSSNFLEFCSKFYLTRCWFFFSYLIFPQKKFCFETCKTCWIDFRLSCKKSSLRLPRSVLLMYVLSALNYCFLHRSSRVLQGV